MTQLSKSLFKKLFILSVFPLAAACGDDGGSSENDIDGGESTADAAVEYVCDPVGANPEMGELLNAPLDSDVEVIQKTPQHPGDPGPLDLP